MRKLNEIAKEIRADWARPYFGAIPYLDAMGRIENVDDWYGADRGSSVVNYFLANAGSWRGVVARRVKEELKGMVG
jgi:hypothetical protein